MSAKAHATRVWDRDPAKLHKGVMTMRGIKVDRRLVVGVLVVACAIAFAAPAALGHRTAAKADNGPGNVAAGYTVFNQYFCADCHTLKAGGPNAYGQLGVNLNKVKAPYPVAVAAVQNGLPAALPLYPTEMVPFKNVLTAQQIKDVSTFISTYSGTRKTCSTCPTTATSGSSTSASSSS
jgi:mono/diheme cytochrome c family protein